MPRCITTLSECLCGIWEDAWTTPAWHSEMCRTLQRNARAHEARLGGAKCEPYRRGFKKKIAFALLQPFPWCLRSLCDYVMLLFDFWFIWDNLLIVATYFHSSIMARGSIVIHEEFWSNVSRLFHENHLFGLTREKGCGCCKGLNLFYSLENLLSCWFLHESYSLAYFLNIKIS